VVVGEEDLNPLKVEKLSECRLSFYWLTARSQASRVCIINLVELNAASGERVDPEERAGKALRQLRLAQGWSQGEVAVRMTAYGHDFHQTSIAKVEAAQRPLRVRELADFAALYGVAVQDLLYGPTRSTAEVDQEITEVEERLANARTAADAATADLGAARHAVSTAEASYRTAVANVTALEGRLAALRTDKQKLPRWESSSESPSAGSEDSRRNVLAPGNTPTAVRIALGAHLRRLREANGILREDAAQQIRASNARLSRFELGRVGIKERDVAELLTLYGVTDKTERRQVLELVRKSNDPNGRETHSDVLPNWYNTYIGLEIAAAEVRAYEAQYIPDLLQTEEYARAVTAWDNKKHAPEVVERIIELQAVRKGIFFQEDHPPRLRIVLDETALRRQVGGPKVMRGQLMHLIDMAELPNVAIQVAPLKNSNHPADRSFRILQFSETELPDVVYIEQLTSVLYLDNASRVAPYQRVMHQLRSQALTPDETTSFMRQLLAA
jgi:transcriptional regulator with XRE-family HTH domain